MEGASKGTQNKGASAHSKEAVKIRLNKKTYKEHW